MDLFANKHAEDNCIPARTIMPLIQERLSAGQNIKGLGFQGVSMMPMLRQGRDTVELAPICGKLKKYDLPLYSGSGGKYVMHRIVDVEDDYYVCLGDNTYHYEKVSPERMIAVVCAFTRDGRRVSVDNRRYKLYCRVWVFLYPVRKWIKRVEWGVKRRLRKLLKGE